MRSSPTALLESKVSVISAISVSVIWKYESELLFLGIKVGSDASLNGLEKEHVVTMSFGVHKR